jgi:hypothetical protein
MLLQGSIRQPRPHRSNIVVLTIAARAIWSRYASPRAELVGSPSLSRPNLFAGD